MRKPLAAVLCALSLASLLTDCAKGAEVSEKNIVFVGTIEEVSENSLLVTATAGEAGFDRASVGFAPEMGEPGFTLLPGQTVLLTVLPEITEGDPAKVSAVSMEFVSGPIDSKATVMSTSCSEGDDTWKFLASHSENIVEEKITGLSIPLLLFNNREELTAIVEDGSALGWTITSQSGYVSFAATVKQYNEAFFEKNRLLVLYIWTTIIPNDYEVNDVSVAGSILSVGVTNMRPPDHTISPAGGEYFCFVEIDKNTTSVCTGFETYYHSTRDSS